MGERWKVQTKTRAGEYCYESATLEVPAWSLQAAKTLAERLAPDGWEPVTPDNAESVGATEGWTTVKRETSTHGGSVNARHTLAGSIAFLNRDRTVALYVQLAAAAAAGHTSLGETLAQAVAVPVGVRWMGGIVPSGKGSKAKIAEIQRTMAQQYRRIVGDRGWVQVPYFAPDDTLRMAECKIKRALLTEKEPKLPKPRRAPLEAVDRNGRWRKRAMMVTVQGSAILIGYRLFKAEPQGEHVYLTVYGGLEPSFRLPVDAYNKLTGGAIYHVQEPA